MKKWQQIFDKNVNDFTEDYILSHIPNQEYFTVPSSDTATPSYILKYKYFYDMSERRKFILENPDKKWRDSYVL